MIPKEQIDKVIQSANIVDIVSDRIELRRAGANYKACCPFHDEKTASLMVSESKQIFKCFGCGISGNAIKFITEYDRVTWPDAIRLVAAKYGIEITETGTFDNRDRDKISQLKEIYREISTIFFNSLKNSNSEVLSSFLAKRSLTTDSIERFKIGFAPDYWNFLSDNRDLVSKYGEKLLVEAGFLKEGKNGGFYDFFRNRVVFPIYDVTGDIVAFSGRDLSDEENVAKYLNSPETEIYNKSSIFFGFYHALEHIRKSDTAIIVEGNMDQITMDSYGYRNCIALCGTSLTDDHVKILKRNVKKVTLLFDGDKAGIKSSLRSGAMVLNSGLELGVVKMSEGEDPDSILKNSGKDGMDRLLSSSKPYLQFYSEEFGSIGSSSEKISYLNGFEPLYQTFTNSLIKESIVSEISVLLSLNIRTINEYLEKPFKRRVRFDKGEEIETQKIYSKGFGIDETEFNLIYIMLSDNEIKSKILKEFKESHFSNPYAKKIFFTIYEREEEGESSNFMDILSHIDDDGLRNYLEDYVSRQENIFFSDDKGSKEKLLLAYKNVTEKMRESSFLMKRDAVTERLKFEADSDETLLKELFDLKKRGMKK